MKTNSMILLPINPYPLILTLTLIIIIENSIIIINYKTFIIINLNLFIALKIIWQWNSNLNFNKLIINKLSFYNLKLNKLLTILIISSELIFFISLFYPIITNFYFSISSHNNILFYPNTNLASLNRIILLLSRLTASSALLIIFNNKINPKLIITLILRFYFILIQIYELFNNQFSINHSFIWSSFFLLVNFHIIHVIIGTLNFALNNINKTNLHKFIFSIWYWHIVDIIWILIYLTIYYFINISSIINFQLIRK